VACPSGLKSFGRRPARGHQRSPPDSLLSPWTAKVGPVGRRPRPPRRRLRAQPDRDHRRERRAPVDGGAGHRDHPFLAAADDASGRPVTGQYAVTRAPDGNSVDLGQGQAGEWRSPAPPKPALVPTHARSRDGHLATIPTSSSDRGRTAADRITLSCNRPPSRNGSLTPAAAAPPAGRGHVASRWGGDPPTPYPAQHMVGATATYTRPLLPSDGGGSLLTRDSRPRQMRKRLAVLTSSYSAGRYRRPYMPLSPRTLHALSSNTKKKNTKTTLCPRSPTTPAFFSWPRVSASFSRGGPRSERTG